MKYEKDMKILYWRIHVPNLFEEIVDNTPGAGAFKIPLMEMKNILAAIADRA